MQRLKTDVLLELQDQLGTPSVPAPSVAAAPPAPAAPMEVMPVLFKAPNGQVVQAFQLPNTQVLPPCMRHGVDICAVRNVHATCHRLRSRSRCSMACKAWPCCH